MHAHLPPGLDHLPSLEYGQLVASSLHLLSIASPTFDELLPGRPDSALNNAHVFGSPQIVEADVQLLDDELAELPRKERDSHAQYFEHIYEQEPLETVHFLVLAAIFGSAELDVIHLCINLLQLQLTLAELAIHLIQLGKNVCEALLVKYFDA